MGMMSFFDKLKAKGALVGLFSLSGLMFGFDAVACSGKGQLIHAGTLLTMTADSPQGPQSVIICDDKIVKILSGFVSPKEAGLAEDIKALDLSQHYVLPGLIDSHVHLTSDVAGNEGVLAEVQLNAADHAYNALVNGQKTLRAGFTTVRNLGDDAGVVLALRDAVAAGKVMGPRILDAGVSISTTAGHMDPTHGYAEELHSALDRHENTCDGVESCRHAVRVQIRRGVDLIKIATTGGVNSRIGVGVGKQIFTDEVKALVETAHLYGKKIAVHAHGDDGIALALDHGADSIEHGTLMTEAQAKQMVKQGTYYVPTLSTVNGYLERLAKDPNAYAPAVKKKILWRIEITGKALQIAQKAGVKIAFGTDAGVSKHGRNADEFILMVKHGMSAQQALLAATINAATLLGVQDKVGSLEAGKQADLIAVKSDPRVTIETMKAVAFVMKDGKEFK